eukprot:TRINITY_DN1303_c0_g1_i1.p1 TRINITY_DN1303_c0_g1~~TRINITY_DN1303_c0_g1_i1.p1  ORF type:complete len:335 (-),score=31.76 TRINITY_DN1303_c0_g1_i1:326-1330(-)
MLFFGVKSQYVSLTVTIINAAAEICASNAFMLVNSELECRGLDRGRPLSARRHRFVSSCLLFASLLLFFCLELVIGFFMEADIQQRPLLKPCERVGLKTDTSFNSFEKQYTAHAAVMSCSRDVGHSLALYLANASLIDTEVRCAAQPTCEISLDNEVRSVNGSTRHCSNKICTFTKLSSHVFTFSRIVGEESVVDEIQFYDVKLFFEPRDQETISRSVLQAAFESSTDFDVFVGSVFFGSFSTTCKFFEDKDVTRIPLSVFITLVSIWCFSFGICAALSLRKRGGTIFFDMGSVLDWALVKFPGAADHQKTVAHDAYVHTKKLDGTRIFYATLS